MASAAGAGTSVAENTEQRNTEQRGNKVSTKKGLLSRPGIGGIAGWLIAKFRSTQRSAPRLALVERIALGPRQSLALVEAEGRRFLVATSAEGGPAFLALHEGKSPDGSRLAPRIICGSARGSIGESIRASARGSARASW